MIKKIKFENYKAFEKGEIEINPITILLGANSVGKSSIIQLFLLLQQTALTKNYKSALKLHGENLSCGENENLFKDKDTSKDLILSFEFNDSDFLNKFKGEYMDYLTYSLIEPIEELEHNIFRFFNKNEDPVKRIGSRESRVAIWKSKTEFLNIFDRAVELYEIYKSEKLKPENDAVPHFYNRNFEDYFNNDRYNISDQEKLNYGKIYDFLKNAKQLSEEKFEISFTIKNIKTTTDEVLKITNVTLLNDDIIIFSLDLIVNSKRNFYENLTLKSDLIDDENLIDDPGLINELLQTIDYNSTLFHIFSNNDSRIYGRRNKEVSNTIVDVTGAILRHSLQKVESNFSDRMINYVSPLRAHPKRYYFLDKSKINTFLDTLDGDSLTEILKENQVVKAKVNKWLKEFGLSVNVSNLKDVIHKLKINQNGLDLDITDVGFGISQVLPVIVQGFLSFQNSLTIIEQPEIHLHPKMQADLADLFIDIVKIHRRKKFSKFLLIETHSEYLLKRLRRRIAEKKDISPQDVSIYFFEPKDDHNNGKIVRKEISETGFFEWPTNFYSGELLKDTIEFIKQQNY